MRRFYELREEMCCQRWHVGEVTDSHGEEYWFHSGDVIEVAGELRADVHHRGRPLEFFNTTFGVPVFSERLQSALDSVIAPGQVQWLPLRIDGRSGYWVMNPLSLIRCLDEQRSDFVKWKPGDYRTDLVGKYRMVIDLYVDPGAIPMGVEVFIVWGTDKVIVTGKIKDVLEMSGLKYAQFIDVT